MKSKLIWWILGVVGVVFVISSLYITLVEYNRFNALPVVFPQGSTIAEVPVSGLDTEAATKRVMDYYNLPIELRIENNTIYVDPQELGFTIQSEKLAKTAEDLIDMGSFWEYLWRQKNQEPIQVPYEATISEDQIRAYFTAQIIPRYTKPGTSLTPIPGTTNFIQGEPGQRLDLDQAVKDITDALLSPTRQPVSLELIEIDSIPPDNGMLEAFLRHNIQLTGFDNLVEFYMESMENNDLLHFAIQNGEEIQPDVAFTAASTIKIPIMISILRRTEEPTPEAVINLLSQMIAFSENPPADTLMATYLDENLGPLIVSQDLADLGMENTFLAGQFYLGADLLQLFETPANTRTDIFLDPDIYNQTVPSEAGQLLSAIYTCAQDGSGLLTETFPGEITQGECQLMIDILSANKIGLLIEAGLGPDSIAAHKHGWVQELDGILRSMSDVGIVFTPGGDYVLSIFIYDPDRLDFDQGNSLIARLSQTVYNFYNPDNQAYWWFE